MRSTPMTTRRIATPSCRSPIPRHAGAALDLSPFRVARERADGVDLAGEADSVGDRQPLAAVGHVPHAHRHALRSSARRSSRSRVDGGLGDGSELVRVLIRLTDGPLHLADGGGVVPGRAGRDVGDLPIQAGGRVSDAHAVRAIGDGSGAQGDAVLPVGLGVISEGRRVGSRRVRPVAHRRAGIRVGLRARADGDRARGVRILSRGLGDRRPLSDGDRPRIAASASSPSRQRTIPLGRVLEQFAVDVPDGALQLLDVTALGLDLLADGGDGRHIRLLLPLDRGDGLGIGLGCGFRRVGRGLRSLGGRLRLPRRSRGVARHGGRLGRRALGTLDIGNIRLLLGLDRGNIAHVRLLLALDGRDGLRVGLGGSFRRVGRGLRGLGGRLRLPRSRRGVARRGGRLCRRALGALDVGNVRLLLVLERGDIAHVRLLLALQAGYGGIASRSRRKRAVQRRDGPTHVAIGGRSDAIGRGGDRPAARRGSAAEGRRRLAGEGVHRALGRRGRGFGAAGVGLRGAGRALGIGGVRLRRLDAVHVRLLLAFQAGDGGLIRCLIALQGGHGARRRGLRAV